MPYISASRDDLLLIDGPDGRPWAVRFVEEEARRAATLPGRDALDRVALAVGLLPKGSDLALPADDRSAYGAVGGSPSFDAARIGRLIGFTALEGAGGGVAITVANDVEARARAPQDARRYDLLADGLEAAIGSRSYLDHALVLHALASGIMIGAGVRALRTACGLHADPSKGLYVSCGGTRFHCFSCGAGGAESDWLMLRHRLTPALAAEIVAFRP